MNEPTSPKIYDVFISYHSGDGEWVSSLVEDLKARGINVWLDREQIVPGDPFIENLENAIAKARCVVFVISPGWLRSVWVREEFHRTMTLANSATGGPRLIPILIDDAEAPGFLASRSWVDFREAARRAESIEQLVAGITGRSPENANASSIADQLRRDLPALQSTGDVDQVEIINRQIARDSDEARRIRRTRWLAPLPGLIVFGAFWAFVPDSQPLGLLAVLVAAPLITELIACGVTTRRFGLCQRRLAKYVVLRDGLEHCRNRTAPGCRALNEKFWQILLSGSDDSSALSQMEG
jgi:hypothetical protein